MTHSAGRLARDPTVLAVSSHGTFWLLDARSGAVRWRLLNGCHPAAIDHGGEKLYVTYVSAATVRRDTRKPMVRTAKLLQMSPDELRQYNELLVSPAELLSLRAEDGAVTWRLEGWVRRYTPRSLVHGGQRLDGDLVLTDVTDFADVAPVISALDARTGVVRWRYTGPGVAETSHTRSTIHLLGARAGRVYIAQSERNRLDVLDTASGQLAWSCEYAEREWYLSQGGALLAELGRDGGNSGADRSLVIRQTSDGRITARLSLSLLSTFLAITDAGIVYLADGPQRHRWVEALDTSTGESRWHAERSVPLLSTNMDISIFTSNPMATRNSLYFVQHNLSSGLAEALALDAQSGRQRWYWHSPSHLLALLKLWGWRTPQVVLFALSQFRRRPRPGRRQSAKQSLWTRIRALWDTIRWDILRGQWLRPASLLSTVLSTAMYPSESTAGDQIFIGTSMGLSALRGRDRHRLWHELLMMEIIRVIPEQRRLSDHVD